MLSRKKKHCFFSYDPTPSYISGNVNPTPSKSHFLSLLSFKIKSLWPEKKLHLLINHNKQWHLSPFFSTSHHPFHHQIFLGSKVPVLPEIGKLYMTCRTFQPKPRPGCWPWKTTAPFGWSFFFFGGHKLLFIIWLVVEPTHLKNMLVKLDHFPRVRGENVKKYLSCHHPVMLITIFDEVFSVDVTSIGSLSSIKKAAKLQDWLSDACFRKEGSPWKISASTRAPIQLSPKTS